MNQKGQTLAALLVVVAIIALLAGALYFGSGMFGTPKEPPRADKLGTSMPALSKLKAQDDVCMSNLQQVRTAVQMARMSDEQPPTSLDDIPSVKSLVYCPIGHEHYNYDPSTGRVTCPHPGHENY